MLTLPDDRFTLEPGYRLRVETPTQNAHHLRAAVIEACALTYGDYDGVTFTSAPGIQRYRPTGNKITSRREEVSDVECVEISFFLPDDPSVVEQVLRAIYGAHPYEEPVIQIQQAIRTLHQPGTDEANPNRHWNRRTCGG